MTKLNDIPFDQPFTIFDGTVTEVPGHGPTVYEEDGEVFVLEGDHEWDFYSTGYTAQSGVKRGDPVMHPSEYLGGRLERDMYEDEGTYVVTVVYDLAGSDPVGWTVLRKDEP